MSDHYKRVLYGASKEVTNAFKTNGHTELMKLFNEDEISFLFFFFCMFLIFLLILLNI